ncbi:putative WRKY transcription factor 2 [Cocos nucifera]|uniref:Putative WRKY transcription factor 2 n=2 Tax=Cocos nucifera TaxID=13894 RepID=A0A8K0MV76_COCNU|nr:putative WRKY transcription factor 2 [Cocos nucifera]
MAGSDDNVTMIGDWAPPPNPSPRTFLSAFLNGELGSKSLSDLLSENGIEGLPPGSEKQKTFMVPKEEEGREAVQYSSDISLEPNLFGAHKSSSQGGLAERMAARAGFSVPKLNMAHITSANMGSSSSDVRSPYVTIPPGLSPTTLLESPVFLSNSMAQPSPTTGKFPFVQSGNSNPITSSVLAFPSKNEDVHGAFTFKPHLDSSSSSFPSAEKKGASTADQRQSLPSIEVSVQSGKLVQTSSPETGTVNLQNQQQFNLQAGLSDSSDRKDATNDVMFNRRMSDSFMGNDQSPPPDDQQDGEADQKGELCSVAFGAPAEDGYNWRKYGQKQVKGSEFPRSYYKCTHPNCQVKKKVERSHEGHITEIIYKGAHNHSRPPPNRRTGVPSSHPFNDPQIDGSEQPGSQASFEGKPLWASTQNGTGGQEWQGDGLEASSSATVAAEFCDPSTSIQTQDGPRFESQDAIDVSSTLSNDEEDDQATPGSISLGCDGEGDETESKRRKLDACAIEMSAASRAVREPRVVVQTTSEVDILDDGYRWRKYGQKVVKGNPNPRSYYKCTNPGCTVRKHVERASHDLKSVITTYEGKHNHDVPAARNSSHPNSAPSGTAGNSASQSHNLHRRLEPTQDGLVRFDASAPLGTFGLPGREQLGPAAATFSFGMGQQSLANFAMAGLGPMASMKMPVLPPVHPYLGHRQVTESGFMIPKGEPKEEPMSESRLPMSNGGSVYHQMMSRLPLGP